MEYKKSKAPLNTTTHNVIDFGKGTGNVYELSLIHI